jgi:hypothetical protein
MPKTNETQNKSSTCSSNVPKKRLLYVDLVQYTKKFIFGQNLEQAHEWNLSTAKRQIRQFCQAAKRSGFALAVFLPGRMELWNEHLVVNAKQKPNKEPPKFWDAPYGTLRALGEIFVREHGIQVHYAVDHATSTDTIASHAEADGANILSNNPELVRYVGTSFVVYKSYQIHKGRLFPKWRRNKSKDPAVSSRELMIPPPKTSSTYHSFQSCYETRTYQLGIPILGNHLQILVRPLRQALYHHLDMDSIQEEFPVQDTSCGIHHWETQIVQADPALKGLLQDPLEAVKYFTAQKYQDYSNRFELKAVIAEICCTATQSTFLDILEQLLMHTTNNDDTKPKKARGPKKNNHKKKNGTGIPPPDNRNDKLQTITSSIANSGKEALEVDDDTRWKPRNCSSAALLENNHESHDLQDERLVRWLLNKITPSNFDKIVTVFLAETTIHESRERMMNAINTIVVRAAFDGRYAAVYAKFCGTLVADLPVLSTLESSNLFRMCLLDVCQRDLSVNMECRFLDIARKRFIGSKRFVGELYNAGVLSLDEVMSMMDGLMEHTQLTTPEATEVDELPLEALCVLLDTCGKLLDEITPVPDNLRQCWEILRSFLDEGQNQGRKASFRMKYMVLDLLELRGLHWHPVRYGARRRREMVPKPLLDLAGNADDTGKNNARGSKGASRSKVHFG